MAIGLRPKILIADEPTTALDVTVQAGILRLIRKLQDETGMGLIFVTHDLAVARLISRRVIVMYAGKIVEQGSTDDIFGRPQHPYTRALLAAHPGPRAVLAGPRAHSRQLRDRSRARGGADAASCNADLELAGRAS